MTVESGGEGKEAQKYNLIKFSRKSKLITHTVSLRTELITGETRPTAEARELFILKVFLACMQAEKKLGKILGH